MGSARHDAPGAGATPSGRGWSGRCPLPRAAPRGPLRSRGDRAANLPGPASHAPRPRSPSRPVGPDARAGRDSSVGPGGLSCKPPFSIAACRPTPRRIVKDSSGPGGRGHGSDRGRDTNAVEKATRRGNYDSGSDYVLEYGELRFSFNEEDFSQRVEQAAVKLGFVHQGLSREELDDLLDLAVS